MSDLKRIGVLLTDDSDFWGGVEGLWHHYLLRFGQYTDNIKLVPINAITSNLTDLSPSLFDGFIITGSNYSVNDDLVWIRNLIKFTQYIIDDGQHKVFGICFGHQLIAKALGGTVGRNIGGMCVFNTQPIQISKTLLKKDYYQDIFGTRTSFRIMEAHGESILNLPPGSDSEIVGWSNNCKYEVVLWNEDVISTQGHPEFNVDVCVNKIGPMALEHGYFSKEDFEMSLKTFTDIDTEKTVMFVKSFFNR